MLLLPTPLLTPSHENSHGNPRGSKGCSASSGQGSKLLQSLLVRSRGAFFRQTEKLWLQMITSTGIGLQDL